MNILDDTVRCDQFLSIRSDLLWTASATIFDRADNSELHSVNTIHWIAWMVAGCHWQRMAKNFRCLIWDHLEIQIIPGVFQFRSFEWHHFLIFPILLRKSCHLLVHHLKWFILYRTKFSKQNLLRRSDDQSSFDVLIQTRVYWLEFIDLRSKDWLTIVSYNHPHRKIVSFLWSFLLLTFFLISLMDAEDSMICTFLIVLNYWRWHLSFFPPIHTVAICSV